MLNRCCVGIPISLSKNVQDAFQGPLNVCMWLFTSSECYDLLRFSLYRSTLSDIYPRLVVYRYSGKIVTSVFHMLQLVNIV